MLGVRIVVLALSTAALLCAHHSSSAEFDTTRTITVTGTLRNLEWINPHIQLALEVKQADGKIEHWEFETNPPAWFERAGVSRSEIAKAIGQTVTVKAVPKKDGSLYGYLQDLVLPDGTSLELVSPHAKY